MAAVTGVRGDPSTQDVEVEASVRHCPRSPRCSEGRGPDGAPARVLACRSRSSRGSHSSFPSLCPPGPTSWEKQPPLATLACCDLQEGGCRSQSCRCHCPAQVSSVRERNARLAAARDSFQMEDEGGGQMWVGKRGRGKVDDGRGLRPVWNSEHSWKWRWAVSGARRPVWVQLGGCHTWGPVLGPARLSGTLTKMQRHSEGVS